MNIFVNEVLYNHDEKKYYRVLWIDTNNTYTFLIDINGINANPFLKDVKDISEEIIYEKMKKVKLNSDILLTDESISSISIEKRDTAWNIIKDIVKIEPDIYITSRRTKLVKQVLCENKISKPTLFKYLRRYWQRGKTPNALLSDYKNSGGKGKTKQAKVKMGRPAKFEEFASNFVVDDEVRKIFRIVIQKYHFNTKRNKLPFAYDMMLKEFFTEDYYYENGEMKIILKDQANIPTLNQLRYFYNKEFTEKQKNIARYGQIKYQLNFRELLGNSTNETFGPGSRFQIDATIADVYIISQYNSDWIIGRPIVYFVIDVFSRMVVGLYVGLEGPSWLGAMMALENTVSDKQIFCKEYGIEITKDQWPCEHLPEKLLADRGEFEGYNVERLINAFGLHVENAAPFRADWKGIVEKYFDIFQGRVKPFLPGYIDKDFRQRGARDYRLDAILTLKDFTKIIIAEIIYHNNFEYLSHYPRNEEMIEDDVKPTPIELWNWGIENATGKLTYHHPDVVKVHLLPSVEATVTEHGIRFKKKMYYSCETAIKNSWFSTARSKGTWKVKISYDPRDSSRIFLLSDMDSDFEVCNLLRNSEQFKDKRIEDVEYLIEYEEYKAKSYEHEETEQRLNLMNQIESIVNSSIDKANESQNKSLSKAEKVKSINTNRLFEKEKLREEEKFMLSNEVKEKEAIAEVFDLGSNETEIDFSRKSMKQILKQNYEIGNVTNEKITRS